MRPLLPVLSLLLLTPLAVQARVGGSSDGGGKGIECTEKGEKHVYLADTFPLRDSPLYRNLRVDDPSAVVNAMAEVMDRLKPEKVYPNPDGPRSTVALAWLLVHQRNSLIFELAEGKLPDLPDDNIDPASLPTNCHKVQVAIQDLDSGVVRQDLDLLREMSWLDQGLLELHETLLSLRHQPGADTTPIRRDVEKLFAAISDPRLSVEALIRQMLDPDGGSTVRPALPVLQRWPRALNCVTTWGKAEPARLTLLLSGGSGLPDASNRLELGFDSGRTLHSSELFFDTDSDFRGSEYGGRGGFRLQAVFPTGEGLSTVLFLDDYHPRTNEFTGSLATMRDASPLSVTLQQVGITCEGSTPDFGG
jgi:hypothetical protein